MRLNFPSHCDNAVASYVAGDAITAFTGRTSAGRSVVRVATFALYQTRSSFFLLFLLFLFFFEEQTPFEFSSTDFTDHVVGHGGGSSLFPNSRSPQLNDFVVSSSLDVSAYGQKRRFRTTGFFGFVDFCCCVLLVVALPVVVVSSSFVDDDAVEANVVVASTTTPTTRKGRVMPPKKMILITVRRWTTTSRGVVFFTSIYYYFCDKLNV